jgi:curved DNA-binding protein CbpA
MPGAGEEAIKQAYRATVRRVHPDVNPSPEAAEQMRAALAAWELLRDPVKRTELERAIADEAARVKAQARAAEAHKARTRSTETIDAARAARLKTWDAEKAARKKAKALARARASQDRAREKARLKARTMGSMGLRTGDGTEAEDAAYGGPTHAGGLTIDEGERVALDGIVTGDLVVGAGARLRFSGCVDGHLIVHEKARVELEGLVRGDVRARAARVEVRGWVQGRVENRGGRVQIKG